MRKPGAHHGEKEGADDARPAGHQACAASGEFGVLEIERGAAAARRATDLDEETGQIGVELGARAALDLGQSRVLAPGPAVGARRGDRVVGVGDRHDPRPERDRLPLEAGRVAAAVEALVVVPDDRERPLEEIQRLDDLHPALRVGADRRELLVGEPPGLAQDRVLDADLADVVNHPGQPQRLDVLLRQIEAGGDGHGDLRDPPRVARRVGVALLEHVDHRPQHVQGVLLQAQVFEDQRAVVERLFDRVLNGRDPEGLDDVVVGPVLDGLDRPVDRGEPGDDDHLGLGGHGLDLAQQLVPAEQRHVDVADDERHQPLPEDGQRRPPVGRRRHQVADPLEERPQRLRDARLVIGDENLDPGTPLASSHASPSRLRLRAHSVETSAARWQAQIRAVDPPTRLSRSPLSIGWRHGYTAAHCNCVHQGGCPVKEELASLVGAAVARVARERGFAWDPAAPAPIETCRDERFGDFTSNAAMELASRAGGKKVPPRELGQAILAALPAAADLIEKVEIAGPGFINFTVRRERWLQALAGILAAGAAYGRSGIGKGARVQVEFVSANPTGPLHLGHGRGAAVGDILCRILEATGHAVQREFYINDAGRQVETLARSVLARCREQLGAAAAFPEDGYKGELRARSGAGGRHAARGGALATLARERGPATLGEAAMATVLGWIRRDLEAFGVRFDNWFSERSLYQPGAWESVEQQLRERGPALRAGRGALVPLHDLRRRQGPGGRQERRQPHLPRLGHPLPRRQVPARLRARDRHLGRRPPRVHPADAGGGAGPRPARGRARGAPDPAGDPHPGGKAVAMGKREGEFVTLAEVVGEVGADAARFFFVMRRCESHLEFDLELAKSKTADNPVFYVQYAHARIASIFRTQAERGAAGADETGADLARLELPEELGLIKRLAGYPEVLAVCARTLEPHPLANYLVGLAAAFHGYYNRVRVVTEDEGASRARLALVRAIGIVLRNGLDLMGVAAPDQM